MDVVLLKDVEPLGAEGAVVHVKSGFARNYLLPRGLAAPATPAQLKTAAENTRQQSRKLERARGAADALKRRLEATSLTLTLTLGEDEKAFGSVTAHDIAEALARNGFAVEKRAIRLAQPIKGLGAYEVPVKVHADIIAILKLTVVKA